MADIEVRTIVDDELRDYVLVSHTAFHAGASVSDEMVDFSRRRFGDLSLRFAAFADGVLCGTAGSFAADLTVPGGVTVPLTPVTQVTVLPTHRRRGALTAMMRAQLDAAIERGEVAAMLIAAEWPIYGRFGYGMAVEAAATIVDARAASFRDDGWDGTLELVDGAALRTLAPPVFDRHRLTSPGAITRGDMTWDVLTGVVRRPGEDEPKTRFRVVHRDHDGAIDGYAAYDTNEGPWEHNRPQTKVDVQELIWTSDGAWRDLWRFLCEIDWVTEVRGHVRPVDEDLRHLLVDGRAARQADRSDHMWVRLLDVPAALAARRYETPVTAVIEVDDPFLGRDGRFLLDGGPDGATCERTDREPDVSMGIDVLGALYLGGQSLLPYGRACRVDERTPGALAAVDRGFRTSRAPWATTNF